MSLQGSVANAASSPFGIQNVFRLPSNGAGTPSGLVTPVQDTNRSDPRRLYSVIGMLTNTYPVYLRLYDLNRAPVITSDTPFLTLPITSNTIWNGSAAIAAPLGFEFNFSDIGITFRNGIAYSITKLPTDFDTTAILAGDVTGLNLLWQ
jgi:hypothetical protein